MTRLTRIACADLRLGMFVESIDGRWWTHPFWRSRFLLSEPEDVATLVNSNVASVVIDLDRGVAPMRRAGDDGAAAPAAPPAPGAVLHRRRSDDFGGPQRRSLRVESDPAEEVLRATETVRKSKRAVTRMFREARLGTAIRPEQVAPLVQEITESVSRNASAMLKVTRLKRKNEYTYLHSVAVCALMINLAHHLNLPEAQIPDIGMAGLLHDIGKMAVPEAVLDKPGALTEAEIAIVRGHPEEGHEMLTLTPSVSPIVLDVCLHHHERIDGAGYPHGLKGADLSLFARMGAICDVYDAVTSNRPYKAAWDPAVALARMSEWTGHFDPDILAAFIKSIGIYPVGTLVRLRTNRLAVVLAGNRDEPTLPTVRAFYDVLDRGVGPIGDVAISTSLAGDQIVGAEDGDHWFPGMWSAVRDAVLADRASAASVRDALGARAA